MSYGSVTLRKKMENIVDARLGQESGSDDVIMQRSDWLLASAMPQAPTSRYSYSVMVYGT